MLTIELKSIDELHAILTELDTINYLQGLVHIESSEQYACTQAFDDRNSSAQELLLDWQAIALDKFRTLVHKEGFARYITEDSLHNCV